jgi:ABC-2 type transport system ATP-binding protein
VKRIRAGGTTIVLTTHYMDEAQVLCDEIAIMDRGRIVTQGSPDALLRERYPGLIIEIPVADLHGSLAQLEHRVVDEAGIVEIVTRDVAQAIARLAEDARSLNHIKIRQPTLEDLFLDLTGHSLRA